MRSIEQGKLAICFGVITMLGACGAEVGDVPSDDVEVEASEHDHGGATEGDGRGAGTGARGPQVPALKPLSLDVGQDTPKEPASRFEFVVTRAQETPACDAGSDDALGIGRVVIADSGRWVEVTTGAIGLSGAITNAHVHFGKRGVAGPIALDFGKLPKGDVFFKRFTAADFPKQKPANAPADFPPNFEAFVGALRKGNVYVNLHTAACKTGEVRGQIVK